MASLIVRLVNFAIMLGTLLLELGSTGANRCEMLVFFRDCNSSLFSILNDKVVCRFTIFVCYAWEIQNNLCGCIAPTS